MDILLIKVQDCPCTPFIRWVTAYAEGDYTFLISIPDTLRYQDFDKVRGGGSLY
ncbi:MAG: hypothetical protein NTY74_03535 [Ignavibacteriae bacterium]|nr:hypothetical protein [Ignavibacteriota bacterium]